MTNVFVLIGNSGAGKDTAAEILGVPNIKWSALMKRTFEEWYGCKPGSFEDREFRVTHILPNGDTPLGVMVKAYDAWNAIDPGLTARPIARKVKHLLELGCDVCFTDTRRQLEAELICDMANATDSTVVVISIVGGTQLTTDRQQRNIHDTLMLGSRDVVEYHVKNNYDERFYDDIAAIKRKHLS